MSYILLKLINMSITASYLLLTIILIRLVFKKMPKYITCILWGIAGIRLILPFSLESKLSLIPSTEPISGRLIIGPTFDIDTGIKQIDIPVNDYLGDK
jgi:beta-lactamase regulating signal transducer with metallopeptidase domain